LLEPQSRPFDEARVRGVLGINRANCFAIDGAPLLAPFGSKVAGEEAIIVPGIGRIARGETVVSGGGYVDVKKSDLSPLQRRCLTDKPYEIVSISGR
jgi:hypothetical protein